MEELSTAQGKILMAQKTTDFFCGCMIYNGITGPKSYPELPPGENFLPYCIPAWARHRAHRLTSEAPVYGPEDYRLR
jgi:hypothetical protein